MQKCRHCEAGGEQGQADKEKEGTAVEAVVVEQEAPAGGDVDRIAQVQQNEGEETGLAAVQICQHAFEEALNESGQQAADQVGQQNGQQKLKEGVGEGGPDAGGRQVKVIEGINTGEVVVVLLMSGILGIVKVE